MVKPQRSREEGRKGGSGEGPCRPSGTEKETGSRPKKGKGDVGKKCGKK